MSYIKQASSGMLWLAIGTIVAKVSSFLSLIVLGWYLSKEEFALYALAYSSSIIFIALRNGGIQQILIQRGVHSFDVAVNAYARYAMLFNIMAMIFIFLTSSFIVQLYEDDVLYLLLAIIAISLPIGTAGLFYRTKLSIDLRFSEVARFDAYSSIVRHASAAVLAVLGFGVVSFILPLIFVAIFEGIYGKYKCKVKLFKHKKLSLYMFKRILNSSRWMIITGIAISVSLQGDYFVIGLFESKETVGLYFFGFQVTLAIAVVISQGMQSVIMPVMSKMKHDTARQAGAYKKMLIILIFIMTLIACQMYLLAEYPVHFIWKGKWDDAIPVVQLMSLSLITTVLVPLGKSILESRAEWKTVSMLMMIDAAGTIGSAIIGAYMGGLLAIAIAVSLFRFSFGVFYSLFVANVLNINYFFVVKVILLTVFSGLIALIVAIKSQAFFGESINDVLSLIFEAFVLMVVYITLLLLLQFKHTNVTVKYMSGLFSKS
ncbi:MAG: oligosaccharide flippase family protein, partial [Bacteroidota bacterium]